MVIRMKSEIPSSEITPRETYMNRRAFITGAAATGVVGAVAGEGIARLMRPRDMAAAE
jgi:predicted ATP-grasp superfamily ATP-dependent carboligase